MRIDSTISRVCEEVYGHQRRLEEEESS